MFDTVTFFWPRTFLPGEDRPGWRKSDSVHSRLDEEGHLDRKIECAYHHPGTGVYATGNGGEVQWIGHARIARGIAAEYLPQPEELVPEGKSEGLAKFTGPALLDYRTVQMLAEIRHSAHFPAEQVADANSLALLEHVCTRLPEDVRLTPERFDAYLEAAADPVIVLSLDVNGADWAPPRWFKLRPFLQNWIGIWHKVQAFRQVRQIEQSGVDAWYASKSREQRMTDIRDQSAYERAGLLEDFIRRLPGEHAVPSHYGVDSVAALPYLEKVVPPLIGQFPEQWLKHLGDRRSGDYRASSDCNNSFWHLQRLELMHQFSPGLLDSAEGRRLTDWVRRLLLLNPLTYFTLKDSIQFIAALKFTGREIDQMKRDLVKQECKLRVVRHLAALNQYHDDSWLRVTEEQSGATD